MRKLFEMYYPYIIAAILTGCMMYRKINFIDSENFDGALDGIITATSLIIGFIGAILPVVMSLKENAKLIEKIFQKDTDKLFLRYVKQTLFCGTVLIVTTIFLYFKDQYQDSEVCGLQIYDMSFYVLIFLLLCFFLCTYRCLHNMLEIMFVNEQETDKRKRQFERKSREEEEYEEMLEKRQEETKG